MVIELKSGILLTTLMGGMLASGVWAQSLPAAPAPAPQPAALEVARVGFMEGQAEILCPELPWAQVRALGNMLRHEYDRIDVVRIWLLVEDNLPPLKAGAERVLKAGGKGN